MCPDVCRNLSLAFAATGALIRLVDSGNLVMVMAGAISMLNQRQVRMRLEVAQRLGNDTEMLDASLWRDNKEA